MSKIIDKTSAAEASGKAPKMRFFSDFLNAAGLSYTDAAAILNISRPAVNLWVRNDDARLSQVQTVVEGAGYSFEVNLTREGDEAVGDVPISLDDFIVLEKGTYKPKRLTFLTLALKRYGISKTELASRLGLHYTAIRYHFRGDDITIGMLNAIAEALDMSITYTMIKKDAPAEPKKPAGKKGRYCTIRIESLSITEL